MNVPISIHNSFLLSALLILLAPPLVLVGVAEDALQLANGDLDNGCMVVVNIYCSQ